MYLTKNTVHLEKRLCLEINTSVLKKISDRNFFVWYKDADSSPTVGTRSRFRDDQLISSPLPNPKRQRIDPSSGASAVILPTPPRGQRNQGLSSSSQGR